MKNTYKLHAIVMRIGFHIDLVVEDVKYVMNVVIQKQIVIVVAQAMVIILVNARNIIYKNEMD